MNAVSAPPTALLSPADLGAPALAAEPELEALVRLAAAGFRVAPLRVVAAASEETFYRLNNLPAQLAALFAGLDLTDPDEDDLEERTEAAQALLKRHFLLDEFVDVFYTGLEGLPPTLRVRRPHPQAAFATGRVVTKGRPALLALKDTWTDDWGFDALWGRVRAEQSVALAARAVLLTPPVQDDAGDAEAGRASQLLSRRVRLLHDPALGVTGVRFL